MMMYMKFSRSLVLLLLVIFLGCSKSEITPPPEGNDANLAGTIALPFVGPASIKTMEGIYQLDTNKLKLCLAPESGDGRPGEFALKDGKNFVLILLERAK